MHRNALLRILANVEQRLALCEAELADRLAFIEPPAMRQFWH
jgi:hypothetical protein